MSADDLCLYPELGHPLRTPSVNSSSLFFLSFSSFFSFLPFSSLLSFLVFLFFLLLSCLSLLCFLLLLSLSGLYLPSLFFFTLCLALALYPGFPYFSLASFLLSYSLFLFVSWHFSLPDHILPAFSSPAQSDCLQPRKHRLSTTCPCQPRLLETLHVCLLPGAVRDKKPCSGLVSFLVAPFISSLS